MQKWRFPLLSRQLITEGDVAKGRGPRSPTQKPTEHRLENKKWALSTSKITSLASAGCNKICIGTFLIVSKWFSIKSFSSADPVFSSSNFNLLFKRETPRNCIHTELCLLLLEQNLISANDSEVQKSDIWVRILSCSSALLSYICRIHSNLPALPEGREPWSSSEQLSVPLKWYLINESNALTGLVNWHTNSLSPEGNKLLDSNDFVILIQL